MDAPRVKCPGACFARTWIIYLREAPKSCSVALRGPLYFSVLKILLACLATVPIAGYM